MHSIDSKGIIYNITKDFCYVMYYEINISWAANRHIRMISEWSCDTEDWSNYAENSALITGINYILQYI